MKTEKIIPYPVEDLADREVEHLGKWFLIWKPILEKNCLRSPLMPIKHCQFDDSSFIFHKLYFNVSNDPSNNALNNFIMFLSKYDSKYCDALRDSLLVDYDANPSTHMYLSPQRDDYFQFQVDLPKLPSLYIFDETIKKYVEKPNTNLKEDINKANKIMFKWEPKLIIDTLISVEYRKKLVKLRLMIKEVYLNN